MARTVTDAALLLKAITAIDANDPAMAGRAHRPPDYVAGLSADALHGVRIGVLRDYSHAGEDPHAEGVFAQALETLAAAGAVLVDPVAIDFHELWDAEGEVLYYEFKADLNGYLESSNARYKSLAALIEFNNENAASVMPIFGQEEFLTAQQKGPLTDQSYIDAVDTIKRVARSAIDEALSESDIVAVVAPTNSPSWLTDHVHGDTSFGISSSAYAAISGYAGITVPAGFAAGLPVGLTFFAGPYSEKMLIDLAYAFEQSANARRPPEF